MVTLTIVETDGHITVNLDVPDNTRPDSLAAQLGHWLLRASHAKLAEELGDGQNPPITKMERQ